MDGEILRFEEGKLYFRPDCWPKGYSMYVDLPQWWDQKAHGPGTRVGVYRTDEEFHMDQVSADSITVSYVEVRPL